MHTATATAGWKPVRLLEKFGSLVAKRPPWLIYTACLRSESAPDDTIRRTRRRTCEYILACGADAFFARGRRRCNRNRRKCRGMHAWPLAMPSELGAFREHRLRPPFFCSLSLPSGHFFSSLLFVGVVLSPPPPGSSISVSYCNVSDIFVANGNIFLVLRTELSNYAGNWPSSRVFPVFLVVCFRQSFSADLSLPLSISAGPPFQQSAPLEFVPGLASRVLLHEPSSNLGLG